MTGRGIDQILPTPSDPELFEPYMRDARRYVTLAEKRNGPISRPVDYSYIWGEALNEFRRAGPDVRIINLETSITTSDDWWRGKGIHYRMHPENVACITAAAIDCCVLANNHVLDWGYTGLEETLESLHLAGIQTAGAGRAGEDAEKPAEIRISGTGRVLVFAYGSESSGIPEIWGAGTGKPGVNLITDEPAADAERIARAVARYKKPGDILIASIHWGGNWGYEIPDEQRELARLLIEVAGVDVIHGHSSHHSKGIEIHCGKPILYGCGDFLTDYEGIPGREEYRPELTLMYFVSFEPDTGELIGVEMVPLKLERMSLCRPSPDDISWLEEVLTRECHRLGTGIQRTQRDSLLVSGLADSVTRSDSRESEA